MSGIYDKNTVAFHTLFHEREEAFHDRWEDAGGERGTFTKWVSL